MLAIILYNNKVERTWYIGDTVRFSLSEINNITFIQADGHELDHIKSMFESPNNMIPKGRVVKIYGDLAKTIVANL